MKVLSAEQIRAWDAFTILKEPIPSIDLMERASLSFVQWFEQEFTIPNQKVIIFCGPGNNGGDGLAIARLLHQRFFDVRVCTCQISAQPSADYTINLRRLPRRNSVPVISLESGAAFPDLRPNELIIDALFGSGLNRGIEGYWAQLIEWLNQSSHSIIAVDIPSGIFADQSSGTVSIQAEYTFSFQVPKFAFFFPQNYPSVGIWKLGSIGLHPDFIHSLEVFNHYIDAFFARQLLQKRQKFDHKGTYGHALLICGSYGKTGAAVLAVKACLRSGAGLVSIHAPKSSYEILQISVPEAMVSIDKDASHWSEVPSLVAYKAVGVGCGIGQAAESKQALEELFLQSTGSLVLDADALNLIAHNPDLMDRIPPQSILTPHPKEFERLFGKTTDDFERNALQRKMATKLGIYILLKGAHSCIADPEGNCYFNSTGNPGMATAGSGDVLTGIITGLLAQSYSPHDAILLGTYLHGLAGDIAVQHTGQQALLASDIVGNISKAYLQIEKQSSI